MSTKWGELQHAHEKLFKIPEKWYIRIASTCCTYSPSIIHLKEKQRVEKGEKWVNLSTVFECSEVDGRRHESGERIGKIYSPSQATWKFQKEKTICSRKTIMWRRMGSVIMTSHTFRLFHFISHPSRPEKHPDNSCHISLCWYQRGQETGILILILQQSFQLYEKFKISPQNLSHFFRQHSIPSPSTLNSHLYRNVDSFFAHPAFLAIWLSFLPSSNDFDGSESKRRVELRQEKF